MSRHAHQDSPIRLVFGVVGSSGELGTELSNRLLGAGHAVLTNDLRDDSSTPLVELIARSDIIHWCIPAVAFSCVPESVKSPNKAHILHDSVMSTSEEVNRAHFAQKASVVHLLMNKAQTAVVKEGTVRQEMVSEHLASLGFSVIALQQQQHDALMARSQAPLALLVGLETHLNQWHKQGLLTASGEDLRTVIARRSRRWTPATVTALRKNPELRVLLDELHHTLETEML